MWWRFFGSTLYYFSTKKTKDTEALGRQLQSNTIRYDSVYLTCSNKLTGSQLNPPHGTNKKLKCETKNKTMSMIGPVQSRCHQGSPVGKRSLRWEGFVEKVGFEPGVRKSEGVMDDESGDDNRDELTSE